MEDYNATTRNGHQLIDFYDSDANTLDIRSNGLYPSKILTELRDNYDKRDKGIVHKKRIFVDMDNVLVDFDSGLAQVSEEVKQEYEGRLDEIPGLFGLMKPMPGAIEAMHELQKRYDLFILSTAPWKNPSAWSDKVKWVTQYLDDVFHKRMVITHRKDLCQGDYLIDDRGKNGTSEFSGEWIEFGSEKFPDWRSVLEYLNAKEKYPLHNYGR